MSGFRHNHYVPIWYQKRFMQPGQHRYYRLDLRPDEVTNGAIKFTRKAIHHWAPDRLFAQDDLYTTRWGNISNTEIEQFFSDASIMKHRARSSFSAILITAA